MGILAFYEKRPAKIEQTAPNANAGGKKHNSADIVDFGKRKKARGICVQGSGGL
jgi:hypothetical protein